MKGKSMKRRSMKRGSMKGKTMKGKSVKRKSTKRKSTKRGNRKNRRLVGGETLPVRDDGDSFLGNCRVIDTLDNNGHKVQCPNGITYYT